jgi:hypothetical protein
MTAARRRAAKGEANGKLPDRAGCQETGGGETAKQDKKILGG